MSRTRLLFTAGALVCAGLLFMHCGGQDRGVLMGENGPIGPYMISGTVTDATTGDPLDSSFVTVTAQLEAGIVNRTAISDATGQYQIDSLPMGEFEVAAGKAGYVSLARDVTVPGIGADSANTANFVLSPGLGDGEFRFVLSWGVAPRDLDAHVITGVTHVYFGSRGSLTAEPYIFLDVDDLVSYGPETITIMRFSDTVRYFVHQWSTDGALTTSEAHIDVYSGAARIGIFEVPTVGSGRYWYVCDLLPDGSLLVHDTIVTYTPGTAPLSFGPKN